MTDPLTEFLDQLDRDADFYAGNNVSVMQLATGEVKALVAVARVADAGHIFPAPCHLCNALARLAAAAKGGDRG